MVNCLWPSAILHASVQMGCRKVCNAMTGRIQDGNCQLPLPMLRRAVWNMTVRNMTTVNCRCQRYSVPTGTRWSEQWKTVNCHPVCYAVPTGAGWCDRQKVPTAILAAMPCRLAQDGAKNGNCQLPSSVLWRATGTGLHDKTRHVYFFSSVSHPVPPHTPSQGEKRSSKELIQKGNKKIRGAIL